MPGSHSKKDKLKKRIAALDDVTSQHKKKSKDKEKLLTKQGKGVAPNYGNPSKVKKSEAQKITSIEYGYIISSIPVKNTGPTIPNGS